MSLLNSVVVSLSGFFPQHSYAVWEAKRWTQTDHHGEWDAEMVKGGHG